MLQTALERVIERMLCGGNNNESTMKPPSLKIVILQRGWVVVGNTSISGDDVTVSDASVIRNWGTTKGIGQLATGGPTEKTVLDPCGTVRAHRASVVCYVDCLESAWRK